MKIGVSRLTLAVCLAAVAGSAVAVETAGSVGRRVDSAAQAAVQAPVDAVPLELISTQRSIREALSEAALTSDQMTQAFGLIDSFIVNYMRAEEANDPVIQEMGFDRMFQAKVGSRLEREFGLVAGEIEFITVRSNEWVGVARTLPPQLRTPGSMGGLR